MPKPNQGETRDAFLDRCMGDAKAVSDFPNQDQRFAVCTSFWEKRSNQDEIDFTPPEGVRSAARRGLDMHKEGKSGSGLEASTVRIARKLAAGEAISPEQARKGNRFWGRNERFLSEPKDSPAYVSALLWGGRPGMSWYRKLFRQLEAREKRNTEMTAGSQVRVNIKHRVNQDMISFRGEGDDKEMVIRSVAAKDETVLNRILYTRSELDSSMETLNLTPAPLGHPVDENGDFLSARDVKAINGFYFGAYNENPRRDGDRILVDKVININRAKENEMGRRVLDAINQGDPIHTSTGLLCNIEDCPDDKADHIARNILFDHDAILLDEPGAATPEQGVGMMVNKALTDGGNKINVFHCNLDDVDEALSEPQKVGILHQIKTAIKEALAPERKTETNSNEVSDMTEVTQDQFEELSAKVNGLAEQLDGLDFASALNDALEPIKETVEGIVNKDKAKAEAAHTALVERVVNQNLLDEDTAKATPAATLEALMASVSNNFAAPIHGGFNPGAAESKYELPED